MKWLDNWLKRRVENATLKEPEWWRQAGLVVSTGSGQNVTVNTALKVSAVYGCVRIIAEAIASLPLKIYERTDDGRQLADHPLNNLFMLPNGIQTGFEMREFKASSLLLRGNFYAQKAMSNRGVIGEIIPLYPQHMNIDKDDRGRLVFDYQESGANRIFSQSEIWRIAGLGSNGVTGLSPITQGRESIGLALALEEHGATLFRNGTQTDKVFEIPTALSDEAYERLKKQIAEHQGSSNAHKPMILEGGLQSKNIGMNNEDSQFIESRKLQIADIARFYRVPLHMLNELDKATFSNIEHQSIEFVRDTLTPWLVRIESSIYRDLLTPEERERYFAKHSVNALLRGDIKARFESYEKAINGGWLSGNEAREWEDMNRVEGLDDYRSPLNMATTEEREAQLNNMQTAVINELVEREVRALKRDKDKDPRHFVDFYKRHLNKAADLLAVNASDLLEYGQNRLADIEKGVTDDMILTISANAAEEMRALLCQS
ncbi:MAG: phage portal protein [Gammaproteobacteria bacterium]|nr:phage portal protein [Gammaproteobacteria bacterium]